MNVPQPVLLSTVPMGGVWTADLTAFWMQVTETTAINLHSAGINTVNPGVTVYYFPNAALVLN